MRIFQRSKSVLTCEEEGEVYTVCNDISRSKNMLILMRVAVASIAHPKQVYIEKPSHTSFWTRLPERLGLVHWTS